MSEAQDTNEAADGQSRLTEVLGIAHKLRDKTCGEISCDQCNEERESAADEIDRLRKTLRMVRIDAEAQDVLFELWGAIDSVLTPNAKLSGGAAVHLSAELADLCLKLLFSMLTDFIPMLTS